MQYSTVSFSVVQGSVQGRVRAGQGRAMKYLLCSALLCYVVQCRVGQDSLVQYIIGRNYMHCSVVILETVTSLGPAGVLPLLVAGPPHF